MARLNLGRREGLVFLLALLLFLAGWVYPTLHRYQSLSAVEQYLFVDNLAAADKELTQYLSNHSDDSEAWMLAAVVARRCEHLTDFESSLKKSGELGAAPQAIAFQRKLLETQHGEIDKAREFQLLVTASQFGSDGIAAQTYEAIARGYLTTYRLKESWECTEHWIRWRPRSLSAKFFRAEVILRTEGPGGVIEPYREILRINPNSQVAQQNLATNLLMNNEVDEAVEILRSLSKQESIVEMLATDRLQVWIDLADAERRVGNMAEAREAAKHAIDLGLDDRQRASISSIMGQIQLVDQETEAAVANLLVAVELTPEDATAHHSLGTALGFLGQADAATKHREAAQRIRASYAEVHVLTQKVIDAPNDPDLRFRIGKAFIAQGLVRDGIGWVKTALDCDANFEPAKTLLESLNVKHSRVTLNSARGATNGPT